MSIEIDVLSKDVVVSEKQFIDDVKKTRDDGYGFVPLVGAGLSAPSGVPLIKEIHQYLQKCIALALGANRIPSGQEKLASFHRAWRWHPQRDEWPPIQSGQSYRRDDVNWQRHLGDITDRMSRKVADDDTLWDKQYPETDIFREAYGATAEWRSSLLFLARLRDREHYVPDASGPNRHRSGSSNSKPPPQLILRLGPVDPDVIDNFFLNVVLGKAPTLGHKMLARLASPLRINTVITQNFEDLIEQAFEELGNILTVYAVHLDAGLPSYHSKFGKNALIKLHGDRYGLRADYSLDERPSEDDCRHFTSYLSGGPITHDAFQEKGIPLRNHLLVVGISAEEERLMAMIKRAKEAFENNGKAGRLKVFWIAYTSSDVAKAITRLKVIFGDDFGDVKIVQHHFPGLLFFRMYQQLTGAIPSGGAIFPSQARLPVPPERSHLAADEEAPSKSRTADSEPTTKGSEETSKNSEQTTQDTTSKKKKEKVRGFTEKLNTGIEWCISPKDTFRRPEDSHYKLVVVYGERDKSIGALTAAAESFKTQLDKGRQAVWLDLDEIVCTNELFEVLLATIARKAGVVDWMPVLAQIQDEDSDGDDGESDSDDILRARQQELARLTNNPNREWIVYLNARGGGAGSNFLTVEEPDLQETFPNGWIDRSTDPEEEKTATSVDFLKLIGGICKGQCPNITVVLLCYGGDQNKKQDEAPYSGNDASNANDKKPESIMRAIAEKCHIGTKRRICVDVEDELFKEHTKAKIKKAATDWVEKDEKEKRRGKKEREARSRFLHACVSVNRVRSPAILWSWAFHTRELDAEKRMENTSKWLQELEKKDVIRIQKGGFVWMRSDVRRKLRDHFQKQDRKQHYDLTVRIHQGLAEWYSRLHVSSKSARSVTEVVYHRNIQVRFTLEGLANKRLSDLSRQEAIHRILQALKASLRILRQGRPSVLTSGYTQGTCRRLVNLRERFKRLRDPLHELLEALIDEDDDRPIDKDDDQKWRKWLDKRANAMQHHNTLIGKAYRKLCVSAAGRKYIQEIYFALRQIHDLTLAMNMDVAQEIGYHRRAFDRWSQLFGQQREPRLKKDRERGIREWIRKMNKLATLGIAVRSEKFPQSCTSRVFEYCKYPFYLTDEKTISIEKTITIKTPSGNSSENRSRNEVCDFIREKTRDWLELKASIESPQSEPIDAADDSSRKEADDSSQKENVKLQLAEGMLKTLQRRIQHNLCIACYADTLSRRLHGGKDEEAKEKKKEKKEQALKEAEDCYDLAIELKRAVQRDGLRYQERDSGVMIVRDQIAPWFDDQQRLDTQHAVCLAFRGDYIKAHRRLNEAEATLVELRHPEGLERGIIELQRADVLLWQAVYKKKDQTSHLAKLRGQQLKALFEGGEDRKPGNKLTFDIGWTEKILAAGNNRSDTTDGAKNEDKHGSMNKTLSYIEDSWQTLDRAKPILEQFRKNAWWTTWYFELRMKLIELQLFASLNAEPLSSLPFVGTQAVPYNCPTMADVLLDNSRRINRNDIFRLARIVESYSNCLLVLGLWRYKVIVGKEDERSEELMREAYELESREENMKRWLTTKDPCSGEKTLVVGPLHVLEKLLDDRKAIDEEKSKKREKRKAKLSEDVEDYANYVVKHGKFVEEFTIGNQAAIKDAAQRHENTDDGAWYLKPIDRQ